MMGSEEMVDFFIEKFSIEDPLLLCEETINPHLILTGFEVINDYPFRNHHKKFPSDSTFFAWSQKFLIPLGEDVCLWCEDTFPYKICLENLGSGLGDGYSTGQGNGRGFGY